MLTPQVLSQQQLLEFLGDYAPDRLKMELLAFWSRHPNARFALGAISCALDFKRADISRALDDFVRTGLVDTQVHDGVAFYSLTGDEKKRGTVLDLAALGWDRWMPAAKRLKQRH